MGTAANRHSSFVYQLLHSAGVFPTGAPASVRMISTRFAGQLTVEQLVDRYDLACRPVRDLLVDYLRERQPGIDYSTLTGLATSLALWFWKDLETRHPGIDSLRLPPDIAAGWKKRLQTRTVRTSGDGEQVIRRETADDIMMTIRAFYLDLGQWALDEPARWAPWAVPCPVRGSDIQLQKRKSRTKARMDAADPRTAPRPARPRRRRRPRPHRCRGQAGRRPGRRAWTSCSPSAGRHSAGPGWPGPPAGSGPRNRTPGSGGT